MSPPDEPGDGGKPPATPRLDRRGRATRARSAARLAAVQALYQMDIAGTPLNDIIPEFETFRFGETLDDGTLEEADRGHFRAVLTGVVERQREIDRLVNDVLRQGWPLTQIDSILRALFRAATFELLGMANVPVKVVISEYVDLARAFFTEEEPRFLNGVLDAVARRLNLLDGPPAPRAAAKD